MRTTHIILIALSALLLWGCDTSNARERQFPTADNNYSSSYQSPSSQERDLYAIDYTGAAAAGNGYTVIGTAGGSFMWAFFLANEGPDTLPAGTKITITHPNGASTVTIETPEPIEGDTAVAVIGGMTIQPSDVDSTVSYRVTIDPDNTWAEVNEDNNEYRLQLTFMTPPTVDDGDDADDGDLGDLDDLPFDDQDMPDGDG